MEIRTIICIAVIALGLWFAVQAIRSHIEDRREYLARRQEQLEAAYWDTLAKTADKLQEILDDDELCERLRRIK